MLKKTHDKDVRNQDNSSMTRKKFLTQSMLSFFGLSSLAALGPNFHTKEPNIITKDDSSNLIRTISYNIFNGAIGYKDINGRELSEEEKYNLLRKARNMGQIPKRMAFQLALYNPDIINFSESAKESTIAKMAKELNMKNYAHFPGGKDGKGGFPGSILTNYEIVNSKNRPFVDKENNNPEKLFTRHWGKARLCLPNGEKITIHSAHLWPFGKDKDREIRLAEIEELLKSIHHDISNNTKSVL